MRKYTAADAVECRRKQANAGLGIAPAKPLSADPDHDEVMNAVMLRLTGYGCEVYPIYVGPTPSKGFVGKPGVLDIGGWVPAEPWAKPLAVEIKMRGDTLSRAQKAHLERVNAAGGIGLVVRDSLADLERQWKERTT